MAAAGKENGASVDSVSGRAGNKRANRSYTPHPATPENTGAAVDPEPGGAVAGANGLSPLLAGAG